MPLLKLRERDILDYIALLVTLLFTVAPKVFDIWKTPEARPVLGSLIMFIALSGFAVLELREHARGNDNVRLPVHLAVPLVMLLIAVSGTTLESREFVEALLGGGGIAIYMLVGRFLWSFSYPHGPSIDQATIIAGFVAGMISKCQNAFLVVWIWSLAATLYYLPSILRRKIAWSRLVIVIPFLILSVVLVEKPYPKAAFDYYWNLSYSQQLKSAENWILEARSSVRSGGPEALSSQREGEAAMREVFNKAYPNSQPHLVVSILRSDSNAKKFVFTDTNKPFIFEVSGDKGGYTVTAIRECLCLCGL